MTKVKTEVTLTLVKGVLHVTLVFWVVEVEGHFAQQILWPIAKYRCYPETAKSKCNNINTLQKGLMTTQFKLLSKFDTTQSLKSYNCNNKQ